MKKKIKSLLIPLQTILLLIFLNIGVWGLFVRVSVNHLKPILAQPSVVHDIEKQLEIDPVNVLNVAYRYNDQIDVEIVKNEIKAQAELFGNDVQFMLDLADCESTFDNLADNNISTAKGVYQFIALTWEATQSNKDKKSEFDYRANIREANIKIANGEYSHWAECLN